MNKMALEMNNSMKINQPRKYNKKKAKNNFTSRIQRRKDAKDNLIQK